MDSVGLLRRNARLRKEYLYRKSLEGKEKELYEKKRKIRQALEGATALHDDIAPSTYTHTQIERERYTYVKGERYIDIETCVML